MVYDRTCSGYGPLPGLTATWRAGGWLYQRLGRLDARFGAASWSEALEWLATYRAPEKIREIQYWGHGNFGCALVDRVRLDASAFDADHPLFVTLKRVKDRLLDGGESLIWFRTCETFGTEEGHGFARAAADFFDATIAGHTYVIAWAQSGLHTLGPGGEPSWPVDEGLRRDGSRSRARWSGFLEPNTVSFLAGRIPDDY
jgi:hypothetical protein